MPAQRNRAKRAAAQLEFSAKGVPDPLDWLVRRWVALGGVTRTGKARLKDMDEHAQYADELAFRLMPYLHPKLKAVEKKVERREEIRIVIGGDGDG